MSSDDKSLDLKQQWLQLQQRFDGLKPREQILVAVCGVAIALMLCDQLAWSPLTRSDTLLQNQITATRQQLDQTRSVRAEIDAKLAQDPDTELRHSLDAVKVELAQQNAQLAAATVDLIPPEKMAGVLRKVLAERRHLQLLSLQNEPAVPAFAPRADADKTGADKTRATRGAAADDGDAAATIYRHGLTLTFKGSYFDTLDYLQALEKLPWHFYWEKLDYKVDKYPEATVTLRVYTLGNRESWIGA